MSILAVGKVSSLIFLISCIVIALYTLNLARKGRTFSIRRIAAFDAMTEGIGRAVEMGAPIHYCVGGFGVSSGERGLDQVASLSILSYVARETAKRGGHLISCVSMPEIVPMTEEIISTAYRLEGYNGEVDVRFMASNFSMAAGVMGMLTREKVATQYLIGYFWAECLMMLEAAKIAGAFQVGGCTHISNLSIFVAICDYTMLSPEIYASAALASKDPTQMSSIYSEDILKIFGIVLLIIGVLTASLNINFIKQLIAI